MDTAPALAALSACKDIDFEIQDGEIDVAVGEIIAGYPLVL